MKCESIKKIKLSRIVGKIRMDTTTKIHITAFTKELVQRFCMCPVVTMTWVINLQGPHKMITAL